MDRKTFKAVHYIIIWTKPFIIWWPIVLLGGIILVLIYTSLWATCSTVTEERTMWFPRVPQEFIHLYMMILHLLQSVILLSIFFSLFVVEHCQLHCSSMKSCHYWLNLNYCDWLVGAKNLPEDTCLQSRRPSLGQLINYGEYFTAACAGHCSKTTRQQHGCLLFYKFYPITRTVLILFLWTFLKSYYVTLWRFNFNEIGSILVKVIQ